MGLYNVTLWDGRIILEDVAAFDYQAAWTIALSVYGKALCSIKHSRQV